MTAPPQGSSFSRIVLRGTVWTTLGSYATQIIGFVAVLVLTRLLPPEAFGFLGAATFWTLLLNLRSKAGLNYAAIRQPTTTGELLGTYFTLDVLLSAVSFGLSCLVALVLPLWRVPREVSIAIIALTGADSLAALTGSLSVALEKEMQVSRLTLVSLIAYVAAYAVAIPLALAGGNLWSLLAINLIASVVSLAGIYVVCRQRWPKAFRLRWRFDREMARALIRQGLPTGLSHSTIASVVNQFDTFLVSTFVSYELGGLYDRAYRIASWPNLLVTTIVSRIGFLTFSKVRSDPARLAEAVQLALWGMGVLSVPLALGLFFGAPDIIQVLYGSRYVESGPFLRFLGLYSLTWPFVNLGFWLAAALGHSRATIGITLTQAFTIVLLGLPLTIGFGVPGTLTAVGATMLVAFVVSNTYIFRQVPITLRSVYGGPGLAGLTGFAALWLVQQTSLWGSLPPLFRLVVIGIMVIVVFGGVLFMLEGRVLLARLRYVRQIW